jgi:type II secretory pathway component GspD/PulD (secretin)
MINKKIAFLILSCTLIFLAETSFVVGQDKTSDLKNKKITIKMENEPLGNVFAYLINNYDIPIGLEESVLDREHFDFAFDTNLPFPKEFISRGTDGSINAVTRIRRKFIVEKYRFTINAENESLEEVLNTVVGQMNNYAWEINDEVVNIFPKNGRDKKFEKLLKVKINNFSLEKPVSIRSIREKIFELPEVIKFLDENELLVSKHRDNVNNLRREVEVEMKFSNLTLRELLNEITKIKRGGWALKESEMGCYPNPELCIEIDI